MNILLSIDLKGEYMSIATLELPANTLIQQRIKLHPMYGVAEAKLQYPLNEDLQKAETREDVKVWIQVEFLILAKRYNVEAEAGRSMSAVQKEMDELTEFSRHFHAAECVHY